MDLLVLSIYQSPSGINVHLTWQKLSDFKRERKKRYQVTNSPGLTPHEIFNSARRADHHKYDSGTLCLGCLNRAEIFWLVGWLIREKEERRRRKGGGNGGGEGGVK